MKDNPIEGNRAAVDSKLSSFSFNVPVPSPNASMGARRGSNPAIVEGGLLGLDVVTANDVAVL